MNDRIIKKLIQLETSKTFWGVVIASFFFFLLRLPSLIEPYWYGDEGIYETIGLALTRGKVLYTQIWDNKPPLLYYTYALFHGDQFGVRLFSLLVGIATVLAFFFLCKKLFKKFNAIFLATAIFVLLFGLPFFEGNIANAENFMLLPIILAGLLIMMIVEHSPKKSYLILPGVLLGIAFLFKIVAIFDLAAFFVFYCMTKLPDTMTLPSLKKTLLLHWQAGLLFLASFAIPFVISLLYFLIFGSVKDYIQATFLSTFGYVGYGNVFIIPQGLLIAKILLLSTILGLVIRKRKVLHHSLLFIFVWTAFSLFNSFFSQRPYTHYVLVLIPAFSLLVGSIAEQKTVLRNIALGISLTVAVIILYFFNYWPVQKTFGYYTNFIQYVTKQKSIASYSSFFDRRAPEDAEVASYINNHPKGRNHIFVWGNSSQLYYMTNNTPPGRFTVAYHINNKNFITETWQAVKKDQPEYIVVMSDVQPYPYPLYNYAHVLTINKSAIYERLN